jgi:hypothetical protein
MRQSEPDPVELAFRFKPEPGDERPTAIRVRQMLKLALRACGLRLVGYLGPKELLPPVTEYESEA